MMNLTKQELETMVALKDLLLGNEEITLTQQFEDFEEIVERLDKEILD